MKPRLLIIGATGFVGSCWARAAEARFEVFRGSRRPGREPGAVRIDITSRASVASAFARAEPECVTLLAALSDIDRCQREPQAADRVNVAGAAHVARAAAQVGARLLYTSTDAVFDGTLGVYYEDARPTPINHYGATKALAERAIADELPSVTIVRMSLVLGRGLIAGGNSYLEKVAGNLAAGNPIISPTDEFRNPIDAGTLCEFFSELTSEPRASGIFHLGASDKISRYELARAIALRLGYDASLVAAEREPVPGRAPRGKDDFLASRRLQQYCRTPIPDCEQVIERALASF